MRLMARRLFLPLAACASFVGFVADAIAEEDTEVLSLSGETAENTDETSELADKTGRVTLLTKVVVGAGTDKIAISTPQAVSVIDQEELDNRMAATLGDVLSTIPGVHLAGADSMLGQSINIRGIGAPETASDQNRIIVNVDGVGKFYESYRMGSVFTDPELFKRVEVLRGPASSTLYGSGALGGIINLTTKDADDFLDEDARWGGRIKASWSSNGAGLMGSTILAARPQDDLDILLAVNGRRQGAYLTGDGTEIGSSGLYSTSALAKATWRFGDASEQSLKLSWQTWSSFADDQNYAQTSATNAFGTVDRDVVDKTVVLAYENPASDNDWLDLKSQLSWSRITNSQSDARNAAGEPWDTTLIPMFQDTVYGYETWAWSLSNTIDATGEFFDNHLTFGTQLSRQTRSVLAEQQLSYHPGGVDTRLGLFMQNELVLGERLTLIPGYRADFRTLTPDQTLGGLPQVTELASSPKLAAHFKLNDTFSVFGSVAQTERLPSLDEVYTAWYPDYPTSMEPRYGTGLRKERAFSREMGASWLRDGIFAEDDSLAIKATYFHNDIRDLIQRTDIGPNAGYENVGRARIKGVEVEFAYEANTVFAQAALSRLRGRDLSGKAHLNTIAPDELSFTIGGKDDERGLRYGWRARFVAPQDRVAKSTSARLPTPGFSVHGIFVDWSPVSGELKGLTAQFAIDNVFNRQYREFLSNDPAYGRTFKVSLSQAF